jgi:hypothetical protein
MGILIETRKWKWWRNWNIISTGGVESSETTWNNESEYQEDSIK